MSPVSRAPVFDAARPIDLLGPAFQQHKFDAYRWMLEEAPVCRGRISLLRVNLVARYDDCRALLSDDRFVRSRSRARGGRGSPFPVPMPRSIRPLVRSMIVMDDPEHRRLRSLVNKAFTARAVARLSDRVEDLAHELADGLDPAGPVDLLEAYARPVPTRVIAEMVGVSKSDADELHAGMRVLTSGMSGMGLVRTLLDHPDSIERLRAEPGLWDTAVDEIVRFRGPIHFTKPIYASEDVELHGRRIARGTPTFPVLAAANLDPRAFDAPDTFDVARAPNHHLGFGFGDHFCLGRQLALMEARIALRTLFERRPGLRLAVPPDQLKLDRLPGWHRYASLPVVPG